MNAQDIPVRAVVPYQAPSCGFAAMTLTWIRRLSSAADNLFRTRRRIYLFGILLVAFGILVGGYFTSVSKLHPDIALAIQAAQILIPTIFFTGVTVFGVLMIPVSLLCFSFLCGCAVNTVLFSSVQGVLCLGILLLLYMLLLLFSAEAFLSSCRSFAGWKAMFACKSFIAFIILFILTLCWGNASEFFLSSLIPL